VTPRFRIRRWAIRQGVQLLSSVNPPRGYPASSGPSAVHGQVGSVSPDALDSTIGLPGRTRISATIAHAGREPARLPFPLVGDINPGPMEDTPSMQAITQYSSFDISHHDIWEMPLSHPPI
jgi:hypothetical protein